MPPTRLYEPAAARLASSATHVTARPAVTRGASEDPADEYIGTDITVYYGEAAAKARRLVGHQPRRHKGSAQSDAGPTGVPNRSRAAWFAAEQLQTDA